MDGSSDITGDEQEAIYLRVVNQGEVTMRFLSISAPESTTSADLYSHLTEIFQETDLVNFIIRGKLIGMGSDGASNMMGCKTGLATLLKQDFPEVVSVHCLCHRLELAFRDITKTQCKAVYSKTMTALIGLHYFYKKSYKNKKALQRTWETLNVKGSLPPKVTGTRWVAHVSRGVAGVLRNYKSYEMQLSTASHGNPKAEGLIKILLQKEVMAFILLLQDLLDPLMRMSLKLQSDSTTLADAVIWFHTTIDTLQSYKSSPGGNADLATLLSDGTYQGIPLKGKTPLMKYREKFIEGLIQAIEQRVNFQEQSVIGATRILNLSTWPAAESEELDEFGVKEIELLVSQFPNALTAAGMEMDLSSILREWNTMKRFLINRYGKELRSAKWSHICQEYWEDFSCLLFVDLLLTLPPTSVKCETTFSQMKLIKTSRRCRLRSSTLNSLMMVKLESPAISDFNPEPVLDQWLSIPEGGRRIRYYREKKRSQVGHGDPVPEPVASCSTDHSAKVAVIPADQPLAAEDSEESDYNLDDEIEELNKDMGGGNDSDFFSGSDFPDEEENNRRLIALAKEGHD